MKSNEQKLKFVLKANGTFSLISGIDMILFQTQLAGLMNIPIPSILSSIGFGLILFAFYLFFVSYRKDMSKREVKAIIYQDWGWVAGSGLIIIFQAFQLSLLAYGIIGVVAIIVALFAWLQGKYLKASVSL